MRRLTILLAAASALLLSGCGVVTDMRAEYVANRALGQARAELLSSQPNRERAVGQLDLAHRNAADDPKVMAELADWYFMVGELDKVLDCTEKSDDADSINSRLKEGLVRLRLGQTERGEALLDEALDAGRDAYDLHTPQQLAMVLNGAGYALVDAGVRVDEGMLLIEEAIALQPLQPAYIDSLGWAYYRQGEFTKAAFHLERAARLYFVRRDPEVLWHLGAVHARLRQFRRAEWELKQALSLDPSNEEARRMLRGLQLELPAPARV